MIEDAPPPRYVKVSVRSAWYAGPNPRYPWVEDWIGWEAMRWFHAQGWDTMDNEFDVEPDEPGLVEIVGDPDPIGDYLLVQVFLRGPAFHDDGEFVMAGYVPV